MSSAHVCVLFVGIKTDQDQRQVSRRQGFAAATKYGCRYVECSNKHGEGVMEAVHLLVSEICSRPQLMDAQRLREEEERQEQRKKIEEKGEEVERKIMDDDERWTREVEEDRRWWKERERRKREWNLMVRRHEEDGRRHEAAMAVLRRIMRRGRGRPG